MSRLLLNVDVGEGPDEPIELVALAELANVACGGHAGDESTMARALEACSRGGAQPGAHPSFVDREHFGRRRLEVAPALLQRQIRDQCERLAAVARGLGLALGHVKPHGALYHAAAEDPSLAAAVIDGACEALGAEVTIVGPPYGALAEAAAVRRLRYLGEGFADRGLDADGRLLPRGTPGALLDRAAAEAQVRRLLARGGLGTICVHADTPDAVGIARAVRAVLDAAGGAA